MVMEHRYVLDMLTAMEGGICRKLDNSCSTFIPANDLDNGSNTKAIDDLNSLEKTVIKEGGATADIATGWLDFSWMPSWLSALLKMLVAIVGILLFLCCAIQVLCLCAKKTGSKMVGINYAGKISLQRSTHRPYWENQNRDDLARLEIIEVTVTGPHSLQPTTITQCQINCPPLSPNKYVLRDDIKTLGTHTPPSSPSTPPADINEVEYTSLIKPQINTYCSMNNTPWMPEQRAAPDKTE